MGCSILFITMTLRVKVVLLFTEGKFTVVIAFIELLML